MEPESDEDLNRILTTWTDYPEQPAAYSQAAREFVEQNYNRDVLANRFLELIHEVADLPRNATVSVKQDSQSVERPDVVSVK